jgi:hypothetical protein
LKTAGGFLDMTKRAWLALCTIVGVSTLFAGCGSDEATGDDDEKGGKSGTGGASDAGETGTLLGGSSNGGSGGSGAVGGSTGGRAPTGGVGGTAAGSPNPNTGGKATGGAATTVSVGQECLTATSCGDLECLTPEDSGFPGGLCTAGCLADADCPGATDVCLVFDTEAGEKAGICLEGCTMGTPPALSDPKCHNRPEMACSLLYLVTGETCTADTDCAGTDELCDTDGQCRKPTTACYPQCASNNDCPDAMFCDPETGACSDEEATGDVDGTPCDGEATEDSCLGRCATFVDENDMDIESLCVSECTFGAPGQCGWEDDTEPAPAICFPRFQDGGEGDQGLCYPLCDCDSDCLGEHKCYEYTESPQEFLTAFGHRGICFYPDETASLETCE